MKQRKISKFLIIIIIINLCFAVPVVRAGFGWIKTNVDMRRKIPPAVSLSGTYTILTPRAEFGYDWAHLKMRESLSRAISINSPDLRYNPENAKYAIIIEISNYYQDQVWKSEKKKVERKVDCDEHDKNKKDKCKKEFIEIIMHLLVEGELSVDFQVTNNATKRTIYSSGAHARFNDDFVLEEDPPSLRQVEDILVQQIMNQILPQITFTYERLSIPLAKGKDGELKDGNESAQSLRWEEAIKKWYSRQKENELESKSNVLYNIAIAHEYAVYSSNTDKEIFAELNTALDNLNKAISLFPSEKIYYEAQGRITDYKNQWEHYQRAQ